MSVELGGRARILVTHDPLNRAYKNDVDNHCIDLEQKDGWLELLDVFDRKAETATVINTKAANQVGLGKFGGMLTEPLCRRCLA